MPISLDRCPHCARPSLFPNVDMASDPTEVAALNARYTAAVTAAASNGATVIASELEHETATRSRVVISRDSIEVFRIASSDNQLYATFYEQIEAGFKVPTDPKWDTVRTIVDSMLFPFYKQEIRFGSLTLDKIGLLHWGDCHMILKTDMIDFRTTLFTENSAAFVSNKKLIVPPGHRSTWAQRGRLALAKLASALTASTVSADLSGILKTNAATSKGTKFVEAHTYGPVSIRTVEEVSMLQSAKPNARIGALKTKLRKFSVDFARV